MWAPYPTTKTYPWSAWSDIEVALDDDCVEALQTKMALHEIDVHLTYRFDVSWHLVHPTDKSALSLAVINGAVNCVAYLKEMGAPSHDPLAGSGYNFHTGWIGYHALCEELKELQKEEAKERWAKFASTNLGLDKWLAKEIFDECCQLFAFADGTYECVCARQDATIWNGGVWNGEDISVWHEWLDSKNDAAATYDMYHKADFNARQLATFKYGRDALLTRLVRGEARKITKSYELGFAALWYYADGQRAQKGRRLSLLLAKKDGRLWLILRGLTTVARMPVELREKIVGFAFFGKGRAQGHNYVVQDERENRELCSVRRVAAGGCD